MIARGFKSVALVGAVGGAALGCYMVSLNVASERAELASIERQIVMAKRDIRSLQTELGTRGRLQQLERWNADVLALSAPASAQFVEDELQLASYTPQEKSFEERARVQMASAEVAPQPQQPRAAVARSFEPQDNGNMLGGAVVRRASMVVTETPAVAVPELKKLAAKPVPRPLVKLAAEKAVAKPVVKSAVAKPGGPPVARQAVIKGGVARPLGNPTKAPARKSGLDSDRLVKEIAAAAKVEKNGGGAGRR